MDTPPQAGSSTGIGPAAFAFYRELELNNDRSWWSKHAGDHDRHVKVPLQEMLAVLEPSFGPAVIFRPYRDARFLRGGPPLKTQQSGFVPASGNIGFYLHVSGAGLSLEAGCRSFTPFQLARYRDACDATGSGSSLARLLDLLQEAGWELLGRQLQGVPRMFSTSHPRAELLRHTSLSVRRNLGEPSFLSGPEAAQHVTALWNQARPLVAWLGRSAAP